MKSYSFTDIGKSCPSRKFLRSQICLLTLFTKIKILAKISEFTVRVICIFRPLSRASSAAYKVPPTMKDVTDSGYVIPHYDFDLPEVHDGPPDPDEVGLVDPYSHATTSLAKA